jgi:hypothetical protein
VIPLPDADTSRSFSPIDNEPPVRWQQALHLAPAGALSVARRALFFGLLSWLPIALWALFRGRFFRCRGCSWSAAGMFDVVRSMRMLPIGRSSFAGIAVPLLLPMLVVVALQIPVGDLLLDLVKALM